MAALWKTKDQLPNGNRKYKSRVLLKEKMVGIDGLVERCFSCLEWFNPETAELGDGLGTYLSHRGPCQTLVLEQLPWEHGSGSYHRWESCKGAAGN